jgi:hypothetical protein
MRASTASTVEDTLSPEPAAPTISETTSRRERRAARQPRDRRAGEPGTREPPYGAATQRAEHPLERGPAPIGHHHHQRKVVDAAPQVAQDVMRRPVRGRVCCKGLGLKCWPQSRCRRRRAR